MLRLPALFYFSCLGFILIAITINSCNNSAKDKLMPDLQGHRGARALMPENTIQGMKTALLHGATTLEMDVVITADKRVILSHEPFYNHKITTLPGGNFLTPENEKQYNIYKMTYEETRKFDVGLKPHPDFPEQEKFPVRKPLLSDVIDSVLSFCKANQVVFPQFNIETKSNPETDNVFHPAPGEFVDLLVKVIEERKIKDNVIIQSFDTRTLQYLNKSNPGIRTSLLIDKGDNRTLGKQLSDLGFLPSVYSPHYSLVSRQLVADCHNKGISVIPWTVNEVNVISSLIGLGVDGIISDDPSLFKEIK